MLADPLAFLEKITQEYGKVVGMVLGGERVVLVADSAIAEQVLITGNSTVAKVCSSPLLPHQDRHSKSCIQMYIAKAIAP